MAIYEGSRYTKTPVYVDKKGNTVFDMRKPFKYNLNNSNRYTFKQGDTLDYIAYKYYNNPQLWWVLLEANPQYLNAWEIRVGDVLEIPSYEEVGDIFEQNY